MTRNRKNEKFERQGSLKRYECGESGHFWFHYAKCTRKNDGRMNMINENMVSDAHIRRPWKDIAFKKDQTKEVIFNNLTINALFHICCSVSLLRDDAYKQIVGPPRLFNKLLLFYGIGWSKVCTKKSPE